MKHDIIIRVLHTLYIRVLKIQRLSFHFLCFSLFVPYQVQLAPGQTQTHHKTHQNANANNALQLHLTRYHRKPNHISFIVIFSYNNLTEESGRSNSGKGTARKSLHSSLSTSNTVCKRELNILLSKLHTIRTPQICSLNGSSSDDLNGTGTSTMPSSHLIEALGDSPTGGQITVLAVHIVGTGSGIVTEPDSNVFDDAGVLLYDFNAVEDFSSGFLHLTELVHVVPELGFGNGGVGCEDDHAVCLGVGVLGGCSFAADNLVLVHFSCYGHFVWSAMGREKMTRNESEKG